MPRRSTINSNLKPFPKQLQATTYPNFKISIEFDRAQRTHQTIGNHNHKNNSPTTPPPLQPTHPIQPREYHFRPISLCFNLSANPSCAGPLALFSASFAFRAASSRWTFPCPPRYSNQRVSAHIHSHIIQPNSRLRLSITRIRIMA